MRSCLLTEFIKTSKPEAECAADEWKFTLVYAHYNPRVNSWTDEVCSWCEIHLNLEKIKKYNKLDLQI